MFAVTLTHLQCPTSKGNRKTQCGGKLSLVQAPTRPAEDILSGEIVCAKCKSRYPILAGVALLVSDVREYLLEHVKGISRQVRDQEIPSEHRKAFMQARKQIEQEHIEDDLEAERVNALYVMNHYLRAKNPPIAWWKPLGTDAGSPVIDALIREHWDNGPIAVIARELGRRIKEGPQSPATLVELGCGVGGLYAALSEKLNAYLGIDSSFASIALARHLALGASYEGTVLFSEDLLNGPVSRAVSLPKPPERVGEHADFIVCDVEQPPLRSAQWSMSAALNLIDMMEEPSKLPAIQAHLLTPGGVAVQSCPFIWHPGVAQALRATVPGKITGSDRAVEWLYEQAGFEISQSLKNVPWLFFKNVRQLELYSVHIFFATK